MNTLNNQKGFTLLEVLIAAAILAVSFLSIYSLINFNITLSNNIQNKVQLIGAENELLYNLYNQDLTQASSLPVKIDDYKGVDYNLKIAPFGVLNINIYTVSLKTTGREAQELEFVFYK